VIILFYYEGMSVKEIASSLGCFEGTVKSRLNTAKRKLKTVFETTDNENIEEMEDKRDVGVI
jgi:RNA polymerase sigma-70 factor (ECF subfamily)